MTNDSTFGGEFYRCANKYVDINMVYEDNEKNIVED